MKAAVLVVVCCHLFIVYTLSFHRFLIQKRLDADSTRFAAEMSTKGVRSRKPSTAAPGATRTQLTLAHEFLLPRVKAFVAFAVVLSRKSFAADSTDERPLVGVRSKVRTEIVGAGESLGAQGTLESGRVFLNPLVVAASYRRTGRIGELKDIVAVGDGRGGRTP